DELADLLHLGRVLRRQLHVGAGCGVAPSDHPGHELHGEPHCGGLRDVPVVHHVRGGELSVCADAVAAVQPGDVVCAGGGGGGADVNSTERGAERVGPCVLVCG